MKLADQANALYDAYVPGRKENPVAAKREIVKVLRAGKIDFDTLMLRSQALCEWVKRENIELRFVPYPKKWYRDGGYDSEKLVKYCSPEFRLKAMFQAWWETVRHTDDFRCVDASDAMYVWLSAGIPKAEIGNDRDMKKEANRCWNHRRAYYYEMSAATPAGCEPCKLPSPEVLAAIERLKT